MLFYLMNKIFDIEDWIKILKKVMDPEYENELGDKYFLRVWCKL